jgi:hypothetical protein
MMLHSGSTSAFMGVGRPICGGRQVFRYSQENISSRALPPTFITDILYLFDAELQQIFCYCVASYRVFRAADAHFSSASFSVRFHYSGLAHLLKTPFRQLVSALLSSASENIIGLSAFTICGGFLLDLNQCCVVVHLAVDVLAVDGGNVDGVTGVGEKGCV